MSVELDTSANMALRTNVLEKALFLESNITKLIKSYLQLDNDNLKAFGVKNTNLTFNNKLHILMDIQVLSKDEYFDLDLFMQFRNKFAHVYECNSFQIACEYLNRTKELMNYHPTQASEINEDNLFLSFYYLYKNCLQTIISKLEKQRDDSNEREEMLVTLVGLNRMANSTLNKLNESIINEVKDFANDSLELANFKIKIFNILKDNHISENIGHKELQQSLAKFEEKGLDFDFVLKSY